MNKTIRLVAPVLPATKEALEARRSAKKKPSDIDLTESIVLKVWEHPERGELFRALIGAVNVDKTVQGSFELDDVNATIMVQEAARENGVARLANMKWVDLKECVKYVLNRYELGRWELIKQAEPESSEAAHNEHSETQPDEHGE